MASFLIGLLSVITVMESANDNLTESAGAISFFKYQMRVASVLSSRFVTNKS